jgi:insulysin
LQQRRFTAYEKVCFHFNCPTEIFSEALERFAGLFLQEVVQKVCRNQDTLKREIRRIDSEIDGTNDFTRELYLVKNLINQEHPYARLSAGNLQTLENFPTQKEIDVGESLIDFFKARYQPKKALLVVVSPSEMSSLETWVAPFSSTMSRERVTTIEAPRSFPVFYPKRNRLSTICLFRRKIGNTQADDLETLSFQWALDLDYNDMNRTGRDPVTATQIGFIISQIIARRGPGSLYALLKRRNWIPEGSPGIPRISFPVDVSGFQILKLQLTLTQQGFSSRSSVIAAVYDSINSLQNSPMSSGPFFLRRELIVEYATVAKLYGHVLAPRPPDAIELAFDGQVYGVNGANGVSNPDWRLFPSPHDSGAMNNIQKVLQDVLTTMSDPANAIIITTASKKAIIFAEQNMLENSLPPFSPASWNISPVTGVRYYFDNMIRLSGRVNEWLVARLMEDELSPPVLNPLIPATLRPPRLSDKPVGSGMRKDRVVLEDEDKKDTMERQFSPFRDRSSKNDDRKSEISADATRTSIVRDYWAVVGVMSHDAVSSGLPAPRVPPEPSCRSIFVLQLLSSRPARADVRKAAHAELWTRSLENSISDLVCVMCGFCNPCVWYIHSLSRLGRARSPSRFVI